MDCLRAMAAAALGAGLLCGATPPAQDQLRLIQDGGSTQAGKNLPPLSKDDEQLVKDLALLERLELLENLELFEDPKPPDAGPQ